VAVLDSPTGPGVVDVLNGLKPAPTDSPDADGTGRPHRLDHDGSMACSVDYLSGTGLATDRVKQDDVVVVCVHFPRTTAS